MPPRTLPTRRTIPAALAGGAAVALVAAACQDATSPTGRAPTARPASAVLGSQEFLSAVARRYSGVRGQMFGVSGPINVTTAGRDSSRAIRLASIAAFSPGGSPGTANCDSARALVQITVANFADSLLAGQNRNPAQPNNPAAVAIDARDIVQTAQALGCGQANTSYYDEVLGYAFASGLVTTIPRDTTDVALVTPDERAALGIPAGTFPASAPARVLVILAPLPPSPFTAALQQSTTIPSAGPFWEFATVPYFPVLNRRVRVEVRQDDPNSITSDNGLLVHFPGPPGEPSDRPEPTLPLAPVILRDVRDIGAGAGVLSVGRRAPVKSGSTGSLSPFLTLNTFEPTFPRTALTATYCGQGGSPAQKRVRLSNASPTRDAIAWTVPVTGATLGARTPHFLARGSSADVFVPVATTSLRLQYGPFTVRVVPTAGAGVACP